MKYLLSFYLIVRFSLPVSAETYTIEDLNLAEIPKAAEIAVRKTKVLESQCKLSGKPIQIDSSSEVNVLFVTTDVCEWSPNAGPIWILKKFGNQYKVILKDFTYGVETNKKVNNGLKNIRTFRSTAAQYSTSFWSFDKKTYKLINSYSFTPDDPKYCEKHKDICPF